MFIRNLIILAKMCAEENIENIDINLLHEMFELGYIDEKGNLTKYGKKILQEFLDTLTF